MGLKQRRQPALMVEAMNLAYLDRNGPAR